MYKQLSVLMPFSSFNCLSLFVLVRLFLKFLKKIRKTLKMRRRYPTTAKMERAGGQVEGQLENQPGEVLGKEDATPYLKTLVSY